MSLINELLHRVAQASRGIYGGGNTADMVSKWDRPPAVRAWRAWAEAQGAFERGELGEASRWLRSAESWAPQPADDVLRGEMALLWARILNQADEPRRAMPYAQQAWACWFTLARNALLALNGDSLPSLLEALTYPERFQLPTPQLFMEWLNDRASPNLHYSARQVFEACRGVHNGAPALALAEELRAWYRSTSQAGGLPAEQVAPLVAMLLRDVANLHDALGEPQAALDGFLEARALLQSPGVVAEPTELRQLDFNIGNQRAKLGQHEQAIAAFEQTAKAFDQAGEEEPALRARHAALVSRWSMGENPKNLLPPLEELLRGYERLINEGDEPRQESAAAQNLRQGNRLWLSLTSRALGEGIALEHFLHQVFATREGSTRAHTGWHQAAAQRQAPRVLDQMSVLLARLAHEDGGLLVLSLESGVNEVLAVTLVGGPMPLPKRLVVERFSPDCVEALQVLIGQRRDATLAIASRAIVTTAKPDAAFAGACSALWQALPPQTRERLDAAETVYFLPEPGGALDEIPLEMVHDGQEHLGLRKPIVRTASWQQMARALAPNHVDRLASGRFAVVRGADVPGLGQLQKADEEAGMVEATARDRFADVQLLVEPTAEAFSQLLANGLDVLHFTGHSHADDAGEYIVLRGDAMVGVPELAAWRPQPAPVSIFCSCLVGLHRPTRTGLARGIAGALLDAGAPAAVAAMVPLPDQVGHDFALALHFHARARPLGEAVQAARVTLARRFHPATWGCFALFGRHDARLAVPADAPPPRWPALLMRCLATRGTAWRRELEAALAQDAELPPQLAAQALALVACHAAGKRGAALPPQDDARVSALPADARLALLAASALAQAVCTKDEARARSELSSALLMQEITDDNYLLVAVVDTGIRRGVLLVQDETSTRLVERAHNLLGWLSRSGTGLVAARKALDKVRSEWGKTLTLQVGELAGVSPEVFAAADAGDRNAMKDMVWNLKTREASPEALASALPWTHWLYRLMGADGDVPMADFCGVVDAAARSGGLKAAQAEALRTLFKRFIGPGEIEPEHVKAALKQFAGQTDEVAAIRHFQLYDRITSQQHEVPAAEIEHARAEAEAAGADGLAAFLALQLGGRELAAGKPAAARKHAEAALRAYLALSANDAAYTPRTNMCAAFLYNVAQASGNEAFQARVLRDHRARIEAYIAEQNNN
jgi:hypothetical protein